MSDTVRQHARKKLPLDGADAQALEHALTITERERDEAYGLIGAERNARRIAGLARDDAHTAAEAERNARRKAEARAERLADALREIRSLALSAIRCNHSADVYRIRELVRAALAVDEPSGENE